MNKRQMSRLWCVVMGHSGSTFMIGAIQEAGIISKDHGGEWRKVVDINYQILDKRYGRHNWCYMPEPDVYEPVRLEDIRPRHTDIKWWPDAVKDPRWSVTIDLWLDYFRPKAILFMGRSDPLKMANAILRTGPRNDELMEKVISNSRKRKEMMLKAMVKAEEMGIYTHWAEFPTFYENEEAREDLLYWLSYTVFTPEEGEKLAAAMKRRWRTDRVNVR